MIRRAGKNEPGQAYDKAIALLARREHSARELAAKLAQRGFDASENEQALAKLQSKDFQSDARFGEMLVRTRIAAGYGPRWIVAALRTHGIDERCAQALIDAAEPDWPVLIRAQWQRRYGAKAATSFAERNKRAAFLIRRGFDAAMVQVIAQSGDASSEA